MDGQAFMEKMDEVYGEEHKFRRGQYRTFSEEFNVPLTTVVTWTSRGAPKWVAPVLELKKELKKIKGQ